MHGDRGDRRAGQGQANGGRRIGTARPGRGNRGVWQRGPWTTGGRAGSTGERTRERTHDLPFQICAAKTSGTPCGGHAAPLYSPSAMACEGMFAQRERGQKVGGVLSFAVLAAKRVTEGDCWAIAVLLLVVAVVAAVASRLSKPKPSVQENADTAEHAMPGQHRSQALPSVTAKESFKCLYRHFQLPSEQRSKAEHEAMLIAKEYVAYIEQHPPLPGFVYDVSRLPHPKERIVLSLCLWLAILDDSNTREYLGRNLESLASFQEGIGSQPIGDNPGRMVLLGPDGCRKTKEEAERGFEKEELLNLAKAMTETKPVPADLRERVKRERQEYVCLQLTIETLRQGNAGILRPHAG